jgi:hypothetical protein
MNPDRFVVAVLLAILTGQVSAQLFKRQADAPGVVVAVIGSAASLVLTMDLERD